VTLWWLLLLARLVANVAGAAREQKRYDPRAWAGIVLVFLISGMAVPSAWQGVGLLLLIAGAIHSWPLERAVILVQRAAGWTTAALVWVGAWMLLTNVGLAALEPVTRAVNQYGVGVLGVALRAVSAALSAGSALLVLWYVVQGYRQFHKQQGEVM
jgi:hypothetical protein